VYYKKRSIIILFFCAYFLFLLSLAVSGQEQSDIVVIDSFLRSVAFQWSSDNSRLAYYNFDLGEPSDSIDALSDNPAWQTIDVPSGLVSTGSNLWSLQPELSPTEASIFLTDSFVFVSPNNNLFVYLQAPSEAGFSKIVIANRNTSEIFWTGLETATPIDPRNFQVLWSNHSHSVVIASTWFTGGQRVSHIDIPDFNNLAAGTVHEFNVIINDRPYTTTVALEDKVLDISADGHYVLLIARDTTTTETTTFFDNPPELVIWNPYTAYADIVVSNVVIDDFLKGSFSPNDDKQLLFVNIHGLFVHNLMTNETDLIRADFGTNDAQQYYFSPNGQWLAVIKRDEVRILFIPATIPSHHSQQ
jgi:hypothetical protein